MTEASTAALFFRAQDRFCALPLECVAETMRPQPLQSASGAPAFVLGLSLIRGAVVPVLDLAMMLGEARRQAAARLIVLRAGARMAALAVEAVLGVRALPPDAIQGLPPLLQGADDAVAAIAPRDPGLLLVLRPGRLLSAAQLEALDAGA